MPGPKRRYGATCFVLGCMEKHRAYGFCTTHYLRLKHVGQLHPARTGRPPGGFKYDSITELIAEKAMVTETGCWEWLGGKTDGYGQIMFRGKKGRAHRVIYSELVGPVPPELHLDHLCRNPSCVNPLHLEPVTCRTNLLRGVGFSAVNFRKTTCANGHPFNEANTHITKMGRRHCRVCDRNRKAEAYRSADLDYEQAHSHDMTWVYLNLK